MKRAFRIAAGLSITAGAALLACASLPNVPPPPVATSSACTTLPGAFPVASCDNTPETCAAPAVACPVAPCNASSPCLAMSDNSSKAIWDLRLRKLNITAPPSLAAPFLQVAVIDKGINLHDACGEGGDGSFNWLLHLDPKAGTLVTGGGPPTTDPFGLGFCYANLTSLSGLHVQKTTVGISQAADGTWQTGVIPKLLVPIYTHGSLDLHDMVVLPLSNLTMQEMAISEDANCVGSYNPDGVGAPSSGTCNDQDQTKCQRWHTAGALGSFITVDEAESVYVADLGSTLCVLVTNSVSTMLDDAGTTHCKLGPDGKVTGVVGDFCSQTGLPASDPKSMALGCHDAYWLAATFAASAAVVYDGASDSFCNGTMVTAP